MRPGPIQSTAALPDREQIVSPILMTNVGRLLLADCGRSTDNSKVGRKPYKGGALAALARLTPCIVAIRSTGFDPKRRDFGYAGNWSLKRARLSRSAR